MFTFASLREQAVQLAFLSDSWTFFDRGLPSSQPLRSATTNRLAMPPVKLTIVTNQPGFPSCQPVDVE